MSELGSGTIFLASHKKGQTFDESFGQFISKVTKATQRKISEDELLDYQEELAELYSEAVGWLYFTRARRDKAQGEAYKQYPRGKHNSPEQDALVQYDASAATRNHKLVQELMSAIEMRKQVNRQKLEDRKMER